MIAIRAHYRAPAPARARAPARAPARARARARAQIPGPVFLQPKLGRVLNEHHSTTGCFRLRARAPFH